MKEAKAARPQAPKVLSKALMKAGRGLGLSQELLGRVIGRNRTTLARGIDPESKAGELAMLLIRCYRSLFVLVGGGSADMKHWMHTRNLHTGGVPAEQIQSAAGLTRVLAYLDAMRGRV